MHCLCEAENAYISVQQIYSGQYVPNFITIGQVLQSVYQKIFWCIFFSSQCSDSRLGVRRRSTVQSPTLLMSIADKLVQ